MNIAATFPGLLELPVRERASLAVELIDSLGDQSWSEQELAALVEERDEELEKGTVKPLSYAEFLSGIQLPSLGR
jgi:hypothetical protein